MRYTIIFAGLFACASPPEPVVEDLPGVPEPRVVPAGHEGTGLLVPPESLDNDASWCWYLHRRDDQHVMVRVLGMDSGNFEDFLDLGTVPQLSYLGGLGFDGDATLLFSGSGHSGSIDLQSGSVAVGFPFQTNAISVWDDRIMVGTGGDLDCGTAAFHSVPDFLENREPECFPQYLTVSRMQVFEGEVYGAWHSTDRIDVFNPRISERERRIRLEAYNTWVWGIGVTHDYIHLLDDGRSDEDPGHVRVVRFDHEGNAAGSLRMGADRGEPLGGLWCDGP